MTIRKKFTVLNTKAFVGLSLLPIIGRYGQEVTRLETQAGESYESA